MKEDAVLITKAIFLNFFIHLYFFDSSTAWLCKCEYILQSHPISHNGCVSFIGKGNVRVIMPRPWLESEPL